MTSSRAYTCAQILAALPYLVLLATQASAFQTVEHKSYQRTNACKPRPTSTALNARLGLPLFFRRRRHSSSVVRTSNKVEEDHHDDLDPLIQSINNIDEYLNFIGQPDDDQLTVVKFYASWCKACAKFDVKYKKLAHEEGDRVRFAECEFGANRQMCNSLGVTRFPYVHIHKGKAGKIGDFQCGASKFQQLVDKVNEYADASAEEIIFKQQLQKGDSLLGDERMIEFKEEHIINVFV